MAFCPQCGTAVPDTAGFCPRCGTATGSAAPAAVPAAVGERQSFASTIVASAAQPVPQPIPQPGLQAAPPVVQPPLGGGKRTVVGLASPFAPPIVAVPEPDRTEPVVAPMPAVPVAGAAPAPPPTHLGKQTMIGVAAPFLQRPPQDAVPAPLVASMAPEPGTARSIHDLPTDAAVGPSPMNPATPKRTIIGMSAADLGIVRSPAATPPSASPPPDAVPFRGSGTQVLPPHRGPASPAVVPAPGLGGGKKTMIGIAAPLAVAPASGPRIAKNGTVIGIASPFAGGGMNKTVPLGVYVPSPSRKTLLGVPVPAFIAPQTEYVEEEYDEIVPETGQLERRVRVVAVPPPPLYRRPAVYVLAAALLIGAGGIAAVLLAPKSAPLRGEARVDANGRDILHITCAACPDGTKLSVTAGPPSEVKGGTADLAVPSPLRVGENQLEIAVDRPANGRDETLRLTVPIAYRIKPDLGPMQGGNPSVTILVEAVPGSTATVMGTQLTLGADGKGSHVIDLRPELTGPSGEPKQIVKEVSYTIAVPGQSAEAGKVPLRIGVPLLVLESPTGNMVTDAATFTVAGTTAKGAGISIAGHPLSVDGQGHFSQLMNISSEGTTDAEIRATAPPLAPRIIKIHVRRVASLAAEAKQREAQVKTAYSDVLGAGESAVGKAILWKATILEIASAGAQRVAVLDVATGCAKKPCLARAVMPGAASLAKGDPLTIAGNVIGAVAVRGTEVPDLEAEFVVKGP